jgi:hypothetical protein
VRTTRLVSERDIREQREKPQQLGALYARCLGVPVAFVNGIGRMAPLAGLLGRVMPPDVFYLEGRSRIIDSDGTLKAALGHEAGVITADVTLDRSRKRSIKPPSYAGWLHPGSAIARNVIIPRHCLRCALLQARSQASKEGKSGQMNEQQYSDEPKQINDPDKRNLVCECRLPESPNLRKPHCQASRRAQSKARGVR